MIETITRYGLRVTGFLKTDGRMLVAKSERGV